MKTTFIYMNRPREAYWNEKQYGSRRTCYVTVTARDTGSSYKVVFHAESGDSSWGTATHEYAWSAFQSFADAGVAPFAGYVFVEKKPAAPAEFSVREAAARLNVSLSTIYRRIHAGKLQVRRVQQASGRWQYMVQI